MREKTIYIHKEKKYIVKEPTVGQYWIFLESLEDFIDEFFLEFNDEVPKLDNKQMEKVLEVTFEIEEGFLEKLFKNAKNTKKDSKVKDFHIIVGKYLKFFPGENFNSCMDIPIKIFNKMLADSKIIEGEEKYDKNRNSKTPDKKGLRKILNTK